MNRRQRRFAEEYAVDHNGAQAAIRAGYSSERAKQTGYRLLANVAVKQLVAKLDEEKRGELGIDGREAWLEAESLLAEARELVPKIWKGEPVSYENADGERVVVTEFRSAAAAARLVELKVRLAGLDEPASSGPVFGGVSFVLKLDRNLEEEEQGNGRSRD